MLLKYWVISLTAILWPLALSASAPLSFNYWYHRMKFLPHVEILEHNFHKSLNLGQVLPPLLLQDYSNGEEFNQQPGVYYNLIAGKPLTIENLVRLIQIYQRPSLRPILSQCFTDDSVVKKVLALRGELNRDMDYLYQLKKSFADLAYPYPPKKMPLSSLEQAEKKIKTQTTQLDHDFTQLTEYIQQNLSRSGAGLKQCQSIFLNNLKKSLRGRYKDSSSQFRFFTYPPAKVTKARVYNIMSYSYFDRIELIKQAKKNVYISIMMLQPGRQLYDLLEAITQFLIKNPSGEVAFMYDLAVTSFVTDEFIRKHFGLLDQMVNPGKKNVRIGYWRPRNFLTKNQKSQQGLWEWAKSYNQRFHEKIFTIDGKYAFLGSSNYSDDSFIADSSSREVDLYVEGPIVKQFEDHIRHLLKYSSSKHNFFSKIASINFVPDFSTKFRFATRHMIPSDHGVKSNKSLSKLELNQIKNIIQNSCKDIIAKNYQSQIRPNFVPAVIRKLDRSILVYLNILKKISTRFTNETEEFAVGPDQLLKFSRSFISFHPEKIQTFLYDLGPRTNFSTSLWNETYSSIAQLLDSLPHPFRNTNLFRIMELGPQEVRPKLLFNVVKTELIQTNKKLSKWRKQILTMADNILRQSRFIPKVHLKKFKLRSNHYSKLMSFGISKKLVATGFIAKKEVAKFLHRFGGKVCLRARQTLVAQFRSLKKYKKITKRNIERDCLELKNSLNIRSSCKKGSHLYQVAKDLYDVSSHLETKITVSKEKEVDSKKTLYYDERDFSLPKISRKSICFQAKQWAEQVLSGCNTFKKVLYPIHPKKVSLLLDHSINYSGFRIKAHKKLKTHFTPFSSQWPFLKKVDNQTHATPLRWMGMCQKETDRFRDIYQICRDTYFDSARNTMTGPKAYSNLEGQFIVHNPIEHRFEMNHLIRYLWTNVSNRLYIQNPFFIPTYDMAYLVAHAGQKLVMNKTPNAPVKVITGSKHSVAHDWMGALPYNISRASFPLYENNFVLTKEWDGPLLHSKMFIADHIVYIGSYNLDPRSYYTNAESGVILWGNKFADKVSNDVFGYDWMGSTHRDKERFSYVIGPTEIYDDDLKEEESYLSPREKLTRNFMRWLFSINFFRNQT